MSFWPGIIKNNVFSEGNKNIKSALMHKIFLNIWKILSFSRAIVGIAVETSGSWGPRWLRFIKEIGKKIQEKTGNKNATSHIIQAISMTVQRGNATSIMGTLGPLRKLGDYFDVISSREAIS